MAGQLQKVDSLLVSVAGRPLLQLEEVPQVGEREVPLDVLLPVDHARTQRLFVSLPLEYLLLNRSNLNRNGKLSKRGHNQESVKNRA